MNSIELEQLKNNLEVKVGILQMKINSGEIQDDSAENLIKIYNEYKEEGTTIEELKLFFDDVLLSLS